jgi:hypothetical protein
LRYGSDLVVLYGEWPAGTAVGQEYSSLAKQWGQGYVTDIVGYPAWVVPSTENSIDDSVSVIRLTVGLTEVELLGRMEVSDLVSIALTLHE